MEQGVACRIARHAGLTSRKERVPIPVMMDSPLKGLVLMVSALFLFSIMAALAKAAVATLGSCEVVFFRSFFAALVLLPVYGLRARQIPGLGRHRVALVLRGIFGAAALMLFFFSLTYLNVADAMLLNQCAPVFVVLLSKPCLNEPVERKQIALIPVVLLGVALVIAPTFEMINWAGMAALGSAGFAAGAYVCIRKIARVVPAHVVVMYFSVFGMLVSFPCMAANFRWPAGVEWLYLVLIALVSVAAQMLMTAAYRYDSAGRVAMAGSVGPVFAGVWDVVIWNQLPGWSKIFGAGLVIAALMGLHRTKRQRAMIGG